MMRKYVLILCALATVCASDIASAAAPIYGSAEETRRARDAMPPEGRSLIYIYRRPDDAGGSSPVIWINAYQVGRLVPGTFTAWRIAPGRVEIRVEGALTTRLPFTSEAGNIYLIRVSVIQIAQGPAARLARMPPGARRNELANTRILRNPRDIPATLPKALPVVPPVVPPPPPLPPEPRAAPAPPPPAPPAPELRAEPKAAPAKRISPSKFVLMLKTGTLTLAEDTQQILGIDRAFDDTVSGLYSIEALYQLPAIAIGGEVIGYSTEFTSAGASDKHDVDVMNVFVNARKYFRSGRRIQPFIGAGLGAATADISGPTIAGDTFGLAYQLTAGVEFRVARVGLQAEVKHIGAETEDENNEKIDVSGTGAFLGVGLHF